MRISITGCALIAACMLMAPAQASEIVYTPINPSFGGNPNYGSYLLGSAQATSKHKEKQDLSGLGASGLTKQTPLQQFNESLQRAVLSQLASSATSHILNGGELKPGTIETGDFRIVVVNMGGGILRVTTTDKVTGASTSFEVGTVASQTGG